MTTMIYNSQIKPTYIVTDGGRVVGSFQTVCDAMRFKVRSCGRHAVIVRENSNGTVLMAKGDAITECAGNG